MGFWTEAIGSFSGAIGGAATILAIDYFANQKMKLSRTNAALGMIFTNINTLLLLKKQHALPFQKELDEKLNIIKSNKDKNQTKIQFENLLKTLFIPEFERNYPIYELSSYTHNNSKLVECLTQSKHYMKTVQSIISERNKLIDEIRTRVESSNSQVILKYFSPEEDNSDCRLISTTKILAEAIDYALFFNKQSLESVAQTAKSTLPCYYRRKIAKWAIQPEYLNLMPPDNFVKE